MSVSFEATETNLSLDKVVWAEAIVHWRQEMVGFIYLLALSTVTCRNIFSHYPDFDSNLLRWGLLFNQKIEPHPPVKPFFGDLSILFVMKE